MKFSDYLETEALNLQNLQESASLNDLQREDLRSQVEKDLKSLKVTRDDGKIEILGVDKKAVYFRIEGALKYNGPQMEDAFYDHFADAYKLKGLRSPVEFVEFKSLKNEVMGVYAINKNWGKKLGESIEKIGSTKIPTGVKKGEEKVWYVYYIIKLEDGRKESFINFVKTGAEAEKKADTAEKRGAEVVDIGICPVEDKTTMKRIMDKMPVYSAYLNEANVNFKDYIKYETLNEGDNEHIWYYYWIEGGKSNIKFFKSLVDSMRWYSKNLNGREDELEWCHSSCAQRKDKATIKREEDRVAKLRGILKSGELKESGSNAQALTQALKSKYKGKWKFSKILRSEDAEDGMMNFVAVFNIPQDLYRGDESDDIDEIESAVAKALRGVKIDTDEGSQPIKSVESDPNLTSRGDPKGALGFSAEF